MLEYTQNRNCIVSSGCFDTLGVTAGKYGKCALVVSYGSAYAHSITARAQKLLSAQGISTVLYTGILPEPNIECIQNGFQIADESACDMVIGIGGGSVLDGAKAIAMLMTNRGKLEDYQLGSASISKAPLPVLAVPTTAGTGSEATKTCVISNERLGLKKSINHYSLLPLTAMLDGQMLTSLPKRMLASTGMDALGHAIESYTSLTASPYSVTFSARAIELLSQNLEKAYTIGDSDAMQNVMLGSYFAGCGINCAGIGLAHIVGQPVGAILHKAHGELINVFLPFAMRFNYDYCKDKYSQIGHIIFPNRSFNSTEESAQAAICFVQELQKKLNLPSHLCELCDTPLPTREVVLRNIAASTGHIKSNPRPLSDDLLWKYILTSQG